MEILQCVLKDLLRAQLKRLRGDLKQEELGELIQGGQSLISRMEGGRRGVQFIEVFEVCRARKVPMSQFAEEFEGGVDRLEEEACRSRMPKLHTGYRGGGQRRNPSREKNKSQNQQRPPRP